MAAHDGLSPAHADKLTVFLSYSRKDSVFTQRLARALHERGYAPDFDKSDRDPANIASGIAAEDEWWPRLQQMISAADVMVFIVSPDSAASPVCDREIAYARELDKRIIAILFRPIEFAGAPKLLTALNVKLNFDTDDNGTFASAVDSLCAALNVDVRWHRENSRLTALALTWAGEDRPQDRVLSQADIRATERLFERRPRSAEPPASVLVEFLDHSRARREEEARRLRRTTGRAFVTPALKALADGYGEHALRLVAAGALLAEDVNFYLVPELWTPAARAMCANRTRAVLKGHAGPVIVASFGPDGRRMLTASADTTARVWDVHTATELAVLKGHESGVRSASFSPDGRQIVTASDDATARVWDAATGKEIALLHAHEGSVRSASFSPDGRRIVTASDDATARVWDTATGNEVAVLRGHENAVQSVSFSPDGRWIITSGDTTARMWDAESGAEIAVLETKSGNGVPSVSFSPDGRRILTATYDVPVWDAGSAKVIVRLEAHNLIEVIGAAFSQDSRHIVTTYEDNTVRVWLAGSGKEIATLMGHKRGVRSASFSPDGERIVTASDDATARVWDAATGKEIALLHAHEGSVRSASFSPDGRRIVTASDDATARVWEAACGNEIARWQTRYWVSSASFSPNGRQILAMSDVARAQVWDAESGEEVVRVNGSGVQREPITQWDLQALRLAGAHAKLAMDASFSADGQRIVTGSFDATARVWDVDTATELAVLKGHESGVRSASFSPDGRQIVTASDDATARVWDAATGKEIALLHAHEGSVRSASFSPDGRRIVTASDDATARVWDTATGNEVAVLRGHENAVQSVSFSPDGRRIVTASDDATARVWDAESATELTALVGHEGVVRRASFSPDGQRMVTASDDATARVWDISRTAVIGHERSVVLAAALARGIGYRTSIERADLLMQDAPVDMYAEARKRLGNSEAAVAAVANALYAPLHPNCYLRRARLDEKASTRATPQQLTPKLAAGLGHPLNHDRRRRIALTLFVFLFGAGLLALNLVGQFDVEGIARQIRALWSR